AAVLVGKELIKRGKEVYFTTFEELINIWGRSWEDQTAKRFVNQKLKSVDLLILDELRTDQRNAQGFLQDGLDSIIRFRTANLLPTLLTTNMSPEDEKKEFPRVYSLLSG